MDGVATLRSRLLLTLLGFVLLAELVVAAAILRTTYDDTLTQAQDSLRVGNRVLDELMAQRAEQLLSSVEVLAADFGFKTAVATNDGPTLSTVLANAGNRVQADMAMLFERSGKLTTALPTGIGADAKAFERLLARARVEGKASGLVMAGNSAYQFVLVPVKAPRVIAWVGMGFKIDQPLARNLADLTGLQVQFVALADRDGRTQEIFRAGSLPESKDNGKAALPVEDAQLTDKHILIEAGDNRLSVILAHNRDEVLAGYYELAQSLVLIFFVTLLLSAIVAVWLARKLSNPVRDLSQFAGSIAAGEYKPAPRSRVIGELNILADALNNMQSAVRQRENRIRHQATHDDLTGLPNRGAIRKALTQLFSEQRPFAAIRIGIHGFGRINDALGYQMGDQVLETVAQRLRAALDTRHHLARVEGNDFLVLLQSDVQGPALQAEVASLREQVEKPVHLFSSPVKLVLEVGILAAAQDAGDIEMLWRRSVIARDGSRAAFGQTFVYRAGMDEARMRELTIIQGLAPALQNNDISLVFQPKMSLVTGVVDQVEVLSRWLHADLGPIPPDEFVALAERAGQVRILTRWIVDQLVVQLQQWQAQDLALGVAMNLSADELADAGLVAMISPLLEAASPAQKVTLEVTESALLRDPTTAMANLAELQAMGARIAVDDFGTGYSSLAQLKQLAADELKIDKSLVRDLASSAADQFIVRMIIDLGHQLGLEVVAEGIENRATWRYLVEHGADLMQGYYLARPQTADALVDWLGKHQLDIAHWSNDSKHRWGGKSTWQHASA